MTYMYILALPAALLLTLIIYKKRISYLGIAIFTGILIGIVYRLDHSEKALKTFTQPFDTADSFQDNIHIPIIKILDHVYLDAPSLNQFPELPRGCEVTSLAMLLQSADINVDKLTLAKQIKKDVTPFNVKNGVIYYGHPNDGFIGSMYSFKERGLGVYHEPIAELAKQYLPERVLDFTGNDFDDIKIHLSDSRPVWVITNIHFKKLSSDYFRTWETPRGKVEITYKEHSVLITGYDQEYIYFNDPITGTKNKKAPIKDFEESWVQMGRQAITYLPAS
jgi:uncharacterized protein YvpB